MTRGMILQGCLVLALAAVASADTTSLALCGSVGSAGNGNVAFTTSSNGSVGAASASGGTGIITCNGFMVPLGQTLTGVTVEVTDDAIQSTGTNSMVTWTWTYSGEPLTPTPAATNSETGSPAFGFNTCAGTGTLACNTLENFSTIASYTGGMTTGNFVFDVTPAATGVGGAGLGATGSDSAQVLIEFTYVQSPTVPEPGSLSMIFTGFGVAVVLVRRNRRGYVPARISS